MTQVYKFRLSVKGPETSWYFPIPEGQSIIGRQAGNDLVLENPLISRKHANLDCTPQECHITDLNSSNGTIVNGDTITPNVPIRLSASDVLNIGPFTLEVERDALEVPKIQDQPPTKETSKPISEDVDVGEEPHPLIADEKSDQLDESHVPDKGSQRIPPPPPEKPDKLLPGHPEPEIPDDIYFPPGLSTQSIRLINFLPDIYHTEFMSRFLAIFEAIFTPIEWNSDNFDLYLSPGTTPAEFLPWFANLFEISFDPTWSEEQRRELLEQAHIIFARRGTHWALGQVLEIYTGYRPEIIDQDEKLDPFTFSVKFPFSKKETNPTLIENIIDSNKPAHTTYELNFRSK